MALCAVVITVDSSIFVKNAERSYYLARTLSMM